MGIKNMVLPVALVAALIPATSSAFFEDLTKEPERPGAVGDNRGVAGGSGHLVQVGGGRVSALASEGRDIPLKDALFLILPKKWRAEMSPEVLSSRPVTWKPSRSWIETLEVIARANDWVVRVDWNKKMVFIEESRAGAGGAGEGRRVEEASKGGVERSAAPGPVDLTLREYYEGRVEINVQNLKLIDAVKALIPAGWAVRVSGQVVKLYDNKRFDLLTQGTRGDAMARLLSPLGLKAVPYNKHHVVVIKGVRQ